MKNHNSRKRILIISDSDGIGGVEKRYSNLYKHLALTSDKIDNEITFLVNKKLIRKIDSYSHESINQNIRLNSFGSYKDYKGVSRYFSRIIDLITFTIWSLRNNRSYDLVLYTTGRSRRYAFFIKTVSKVSVVYAYTLKENTKFYERYEKLSQKGYHFDCLSENIANTLRKSNIIPQKRIHTTPNSFIDFDNTDNNFSDKENLVSFVARFVKIKGVDLLIQAIDFVTSQNNDIRFIVIGYGPMEEEIKNFIKNRNLNDRVEVVYSEKVKKFLVRSKVFLSLQTEENYPSQSLLEAMACKNAIVATSVGLTYKLIDESCGILTANNGQEIGQAILSLFNRNDLEVLGETSRHKIINKHTAANYYNYVLSEFL